MERSEELYGAILRKDLETADKLISEGVTLDSEIREALIKGPGSIANYSASRCNYYKKFTDFAEHASVDDFAAAVEKLYELVGEPLYNTIGEYRYGIYRDRFYDPKFFETLLKCCSGKQMRKQWTMREAIDRNSVRLLEICAKYGWLKIPRIRDAVIEYSQKKDRPECTAWLLEFKNRTADLAAEQTRAEKKMLRELNADPNSLTELRKIWKFEKRGDGTVIILGYKGDRIEITVPEKIGGDTVTALGEYAFSPYANRIRADRRALRKAITKVILPDTIESIGEFAFFQCRSLTRIELPESLTAVSKGMLDITGLERIVIGGNVKKIGGVAFWGCRDLRYVKLCEGVAEIDVAAFYNCGNLEIIELPRSLEKAPPCTMTESPFWNCVKLTAVVYKGSYAEKYCMENKINYKYAEE